MLHDEEEEDASTTKIIGCFESLKAKYESLRTIEQKIQELTAHDFLEEEINGFANYEDRYLEILSEVEGLRNEQSMSQAMVPAGEGHSATQGLGSSG